MLNISWLKISIVLVLLIYLLTGCAGSHIKGIPIDVSSEIDGLVGEGFNFGHLVIMDANTGKHVLLKREDKDENGNLKYETTRITGPQSISDVRNVSTSSVHKVNIEEERYSFCNIVTINGGTELICKKEGPVKSDTYDQGSRPAKSAKTQVKGITGIVPRPITLPGPLVRDLEELGKGRVNDIGFIVLYDISGTKKQLLISEGYQTADMSLFDSVKELSRRASTSAVFYHRDNPCCKTETDSSGTRTRTCDIFARSC